MTRTIRLAKIADRKIAVALKQIEALQARKAPIQAKWLELGWAKCEEMLDVIGAQIVALYEEIDALREGLTRPTGRTERNLHKVR